MLTNFLANIYGQFVIDIGGQLAKDAQTSAFPMGVWLPSRGSHAVSVWTRYVVPYEAVPLLPT